MALNDVAGHVSAVVALAYHALVAVHLFPEGVLAAHEEEEHGGGVMNGCRRLCRGIGGAGLAEGLSYATYRRRERLP